MAIDDSSGVFGGDGSVKWTIDAANTREGSVTTVRNEEKGHRQEGINETALDGSDFTIEIRLPADRDRESAFRAKLRQEADKPSGGDRVVFAIPIEGCTLDQIRIIWSSVVTAKGTPSRTRPAPKGRAVKRKSSAKSRRRAQSRR